VAAVGGGEREERKMLRSTSSSIFSLFGVLRLLYCRMPSPSRALWREFVNSSPPEESESTNSRRRARSRWRVCRLCFAQSRISRVLGNRASQQVMRLQSELHAPRLPWCLVVSLRACRVLWLGTRDEGLPPTFWTNGCCYCCCCYCGPCCVVYLAASSINSKSLV
jgi:hypothetical protein